MPLYSSTWRPAPPVGRPLLATDAMVAKEETIGIVFALDLRQPIVVLAPKLALPICLEVIGFVDVATGAGRGFADDVHRCRHPIPSSLPLGPVRLMTRHPWIRSCVGAEDDQRCRFEDRRVHRRLSTAMHRLGGGAGLSLVEMQRDRPVPRRFEQLGGKGLRLGSFEELERDPTRLIGVPVSRDLIGVAGPPEAVCGLIRPRISLNGAWRILLDEFVVPHS